MVYIINNVQIYMLCDTLFLVYLYIDITLIIMYYNINRKTKSEGNKMERIEELEKELTKVCGTYENDCSQCPKQTECDEYCKLVGIYEIVNREDSEVLK